MNALSQDFRFALRRLRKDAGFSIAVLSMLALGLAASVAMFSVLRGVVLSSLPYPDAPRVVAVAAQNAPQSVADGQLTPAEAFALERDDALFAAFGFYTWNGITVIEGGKPREITTNVVSSEFFPALGITPLHGRWLDAGDGDASTPRIVLSYEEWQRLFGGDANAIGQLVDSDRGRVEVVGVMPPTFAFPWSGVGGWQPMSRKGSDESAPGFRFARFLFGIGRLARGVSREQAKSRLEAISAEVRERHGLDDIGWRIGAKQVLEEMIGSVRAVLWGAFAIALLVLAIACTNAGILVNARLVARGRELAIAQALGAGAARLRRVLALEIALIVVVAVALGTWLIQLGLEAFRALAADSLPRVDAIGVDSTVVAFAFAAGAVAVALILAQGWRIATHPAEAMRHSGATLASRSASTRQRFLPSIGIAMSTVAVVAAFALALSLAAMQAVPPGFRTEGVYVLQMFRDDEREAFVPFATQVQERLLALPGVERVAVSTSTPMSGIGTYVVDVQVPGRDEAEPLQASVRRVTPGYLDLLAIPLLGGRNFTGEDRAGTERVALVSRALAQRVFGSESPLDRRILLPLRSGPRVEYRIVGLVEDVRNEALRSAPQPEVLVPFAQSPWLGMSFLVHGATLKPDILEQMQAVVWEIDPREGITRMFPLAEDVELQLQPAKFFARTIGLFALVSLFLGALGVYAVSAFVQRRRTAEYGLKLAIGAQPRAMAAEVLGETLRVAAIGMAMGLLGAWLALRLLSAQLYGVAAEGLGAYAGGIAAIAFAALLAGLLPALRAARIDPMTALRNE